MWEEMCMAYLNYCPGILMDEQRETQRTAIRIPGLQLRFEPQTYRTRSRCINCTTTFGRLPAQGSM
jgi:hypothetical protein